MRLHTSLLLSLLTLTLTTASPAPDLTERDPLPDLSSDLHARDPSRLGAIPLHPERDFTPDLHGNHEREAPLPTLRDRDALTSPASSPADPTPILAVRQESRETRVPARKTLWSFGKNIVVESKKLSSDPNSPKVGPIQCLGPYGRTFCQKWCYCSKEPKTVGLVLCDEKVKKFRKGDAAIKEIHALSLRGFCGPVCSCWVDGNTKFRPLREAEWDELRVKLDSLHADRDD